MSSLICKYAVVFWVSGLGLIVSCSEDDPSGRRDAGDVVVDASDASAVPDVSVPDASNDRDAGPEDFQVTATEPMPGAQLALADLPDAVRIEFSRPVRDPAELMTEVRVARDPDGPGGAPRISDFVAPELISENEVEIPLQGNQIRGVGDFTIILDFEDRTGQLLEPGPILSSSEFSFSVTP
ncbi:MAG TPA: hypothetical protein RMG48_05055 [Myxococcales bacterium LLY-WYZ-16_1]|nr:hypothetical protein [Myxococcales bacterium LLY-WYZ-16_1]